MKLRYATAGLIMILWIASIPAASFADANGVANESKRSQIYFGDLHTHTNISGDAVLMQVLHGENRGPEMACEYAHACAQVDFFGLSDHAEMLHRQAWDDTQDAIVQCNQKMVRKGEISGSNAPPMVAFTGFEWTSSATGKYWGHKNVFFRNDTVPPMPAAANVVADIGVANFGALWSSLKLYQAMDIRLEAGIRSVRTAGKVAGMKHCGEDVDPDNCAIVAKEPKDLWAYLNQFYDQHEYASKNYDAIVIPHGTAWGMAKVGTDWTIQNNPKQHDANLQRLIEVFSGHGNSEEYRTDDEIESCNVRAGRLMWANCKRDGDDYDTCLEKAQQAAKTGKLPFRTRPEDWGTCNECTDCFMPAERYQPDGSVQAALALTGFDDQTKSRYQFGFIGSTDDHGGRPASVQESRALSDWGLAMGFLSSLETDFAPKGRNIDEAQRAASYFYPGGLVAVHASERSRDAIWQGLKNRRVYGTSGPRIQLWFWAEADGRRIEMGDKVSLGKAPVFKVEARGGPVELPGCSERTRKEFGDEVVNNVCLGACYNPSSRRTGIDRIEVVKIMPQTAKNQPLAERIIDPFLVIENTGRTADGEVSPWMEASFSDPGFDQDSLYYVRAIQTPTPAVNGTPMMAENGGFASCPAVGGAGADQCLSMAEERAWSSPIYIDKTQ